MSYKRGNLIKANHWTETDPRVVAYLAQRLGEVVQREEGADLEAGGFTVEVKAATEWVADAHAYGGRRRGRFRLHTWEEADFFLFVLILPNDQLRMKLVESAEVFKRWPLDNSSIPAAGIFGGGVLDLDYVLPGVTPGRQACRRHVTPRGGGGNKRAEAWP